MVLNAGEAFANALRLVYDPVPGSPGHAEVRHSDDSDLELADFLASDVSTDINHIAELHLPKP